MHPWNYQFQRFGVYFVDIPSKFLLSILNTGGYFLNMAVKPSFCKKE